MEVLYHHIRPYFVGIFSYIGLIYGRYLQFRFLRWPLTNPHFKLRGVYQSLVIGILHTDSL